MNYDFEGLWFQIYSKVLKLNQTLKEDALDKSERFLYSVNHIMGSID